MTKFALSFLCIVVLAVAGCAALDHFFGVVPPGAGPTPGPGGAPSDTIGGLANQYLPYGGVLMGVLGIARWFYTEIRKRQMDSMFKSVVLGIKNTIDAADGSPVDKEALYSSITDASKLYANREVFSQLVDKIKAEWDARKAKS